MTIEFYPYDAGDGASVREDDWRDMARLWRNTGIIPSKLNEFECYADNTGMQVKIKSGHAWIEGHLVKSDAEEVATIPAADGSNPRKDLVVLRNHFGNNTISIEVIEGTPASSPSAPTVSQNTTMWEIALAVVDVAAGETSVEAGHVTDQRSFSTGNQGAAEEIRESAGPTDLSVGAIADGQRLVRSGGTIVGEDGLPALGSNKEILGVVSSALAYGDLYDFLNIGNNEVLTAESTTSTNYTDLVTAGPSITINCPNGIALIWVSCQVITDTLEQDMLVGVRVDATDPPDGSREFEFRPGHAENDPTTGLQNLRGLVGNYVYFSGLGSGNHTFKLRYKVDTASGTNNFYNRKILGIGL